jgi:predicted transcriptional regulator
MSDGDNPPIIPGLTAEIVSAYLSHHSLATTDVGRLVSVVGLELSGLGHVPEPSAGPQPAVPVPESVRRDRLVCLVCGQPFKSLRRHLRTSHELTPEAYRERFGLVRDYPMVAAASSEERAAIARRTGLGLRRWPVPEAVVVPEVAAEAEPTGSPRRPQQSEPAAAAEAAPQPVAKPVRGRRVARKVEATAAIDPARQPQPEAEPKPRRPRRPKR